MCMNGVRIGMVKIITNMERLKIQKVRNWLLFAFCEEDVFGIVQANAVLLNEAPTTAAKAKRLLGSGWLRIKIGDPDDLEQHRTHTIVQLVELATSQ